MAITVKAGYENENPAVFVTRINPHSAWEDNIELTPREAEALLKKLPEIIAKVKGMKKNKW